MKDYSQFGEQAHILGALAEAGFTSVGRFLDIGCWDPITFSNTRALVELGWSGVLVEPAPGPMLELLRCCPNPQCAVGIDERKHEVYGERKQRPCENCGGKRYGFDERFTIIQAAMGLLPGYSKICVTDDALSTNDEESRKKWDKVGGFYGWLTVPVITWELLTNQFGGFNFVNIDAEGVSADLFLKMLSLGIYPTVVCVEHDNRTTQLVSAATECSYRAIHCNGTNLVVARP